MIEVKGTKDTSSDAPVAARYSFPGGEGHSRIPAYIAMLVLAVVAYLRSAVPFLNPSRPEEASAAGEEDRQALHLKDVQEGTAETPPGEAGPLEPIEALEVAELSPAYSNNVVSFPHRLIDSPALDFEVSVPDFRPAVRPNLEPWNPTSSGGASSAAPSPSDDEGPEQSDDPDHRNRKPVTNGAVRLNETFAGIAVMIGLSELLVNVTDADGDELTIRNATVSSGSIGIVEGGLVFSSNAAAQSGEVVIHYEIFDGTTAVPQVAYIPLLRNPSISGSDGDDLLVGTAGIDHIDALDGGDLINAGAGDDVIFGGAGDDNIVAGAGRDIILAGSGDDIVFAGAGNDLVAGGDGNDRLYGEAGADTLLGEAGDDLLSGGTDNDWLSGGEGHDRLEGDGGNDIIEGGAGNDSMVDGTGSDIVIGDAGDDLVLVSLDGEPDLFEGAAGNDTFDLSAAQLHVAIDLMAGTASGVENGADQLSGFETIRGGSGDDLFQDGAGGERISGGSGDDVVRAATDASDDRFEGEDGNDTLDYSASAESVTVDLLQGTASGIEVGEDSISGFEAFIGGSGDDVFEIGQTSVKLTGGNGDDVFSFEVPMEAADAPQLIHDILDFVAGDRVLVAHYEFTFSRRDEFEDRFSRYYRDRDEEDEELELRIRHRTEDGQDLTVFDLDYDGDLEFEMSIILFGHHQPLIYDTVTA